MFICHFNIQTFNEVSFSSCFDEAYVPAYRALGGNVFGIINNKATEFKFVNNDFCIRTSNFEERETIEKNDGIICMTHNEGFENVVDEIVKMLEDHRLVICKVVNISGIIIENGRKTEGSASVHYVLIYGCDTDKSEFYILEHEKNVSTTYLPCRIGFKMIEKGYYEALEYDGQIQNIVVLSQKAEHKYIDYGNENYRKYFAKNRYFETREMKSLIALRQHLEILPNMTTKEINSCKEIDVLSEMIKYFQREKWLLNSIDINIPYFYLIIKNINLLRTYCIKYTYTNLSKYQEKIKKYCNYTNICVSDWFRELRNCMIEKYK